MDLGSEVVISNDFMKGKNVVNVKTAAMGDKIASNREEVIDLVAKIAASRDIKVIVLKMTSKLDSNFSSRRWREV